MSNLAKLAKQALQLEQDRQYEKALVAFSRLFDEAASAEEEVDTALFNRAGDVAMRVGDAAAAVRYFERAIDAYAVGGLLNNAIAVCNKVLRVAPEHAATHHTLGVLHAKQGFRGDAKHHFVEYAERMHRAGRDDEALRALGEFAALCPPGDDVRALLAQHLAKGNRGTDVVARLNALLADTPRSAETAAPNDSGRASSAPTSASAPTSSTSQSDEDRPRDLVFLDIGLESGYGSVDAPDLPLLAGLESTSDASVFDFGPTVTFDDGVALAEPTSASSIHDLTLDDVTLDDTRLGRSRPLDDSFERPLDASLIDDSLLDFGGAAGLVDGFLDLSIDSSLHDAPDDSSSERPVGVARGDRSDLAGDAPPDLSLPLLDLLDEPDDAPAPSGDASEDAADVAASPLEDFVLAAEPGAAVRRPPDVLLNELPSELPMLSLAGWIGSVSAVASEYPAPEQESAATREPERERLVENPEPAADVEFVDLGAWLRESEPDPSTRMTSDDATPTGDEAADFERLLGAFRAGVARNVDEGDFDSHYDLGIAFRGMGLIDDAIAELQKAARAPRGGLRAREALGQCFLDRGSPELVVETLQHDLDEGTVGLEAARQGTAHLGVLYLLGVAFDRLGQPDRARACLQRVVAADIQFRDAAARLSLLSASSPSS